MAEYSILPIEVNPGVLPDTDRTEQSSFHYVHADKIRFRDGLPEKIGGWEAFSFDNDDQIQGCARTVYSYNLNGRIWNIIGTNSKLYSLLGSQLTNITPLKAATTAIANSLSTYYKTLGSNPITTTDGSSTITIADTATKVRVGDTIQISGVSGAINGIPDTEINSSHFVRTQTTNSFTVTVSTSATSSGSGGGGSVVLSTGIITVSQTSHGFLSGDRVKIAAAADTGGIVAAEINKEFIIRNVSTNTYDISTDDLATSSVSGGGGSNTTVQGEIDAGSCDTLAGQGYGMGLYGVGLYGISKTSTASSTFPRRWVVDRFGNLVIMTAGGQTGLYSWDSDTLEAPTLVANAPTAIDYAFVTNNIAVTLGAGGVRNRVQWSDIANLTTWTPAATNSAGSDDLEGADGFISHLSVQGIDMLFTPSQIYLMQYIGGAFVFSFQKLTDITGIIAQNARVEALGTGYWMGTDNFYMWRGGNVEIVPSNTTNETTLKKYVFDNLNYGQKEKIFAWYNEAFNEIWWHYPSAGSNEPDRLVRYNIIENTWTPDTMGRTAAEYPDVKLTFPRLISDDNTLYRHELGANDGVDSSLAFSLVLPYRRQNLNGTDTVDIGGIVPDSLQTGNISFSVRAKKYPQSVPLEQTGFTITPTTERLAFNLNGRFWQYEISGDELDQTWRAGVWMEEVKMSTRR